MADDLYSALIGDGASSNGEVIANALRRRRQMGTLGLLTGDKVLGAAGKDLSESSDDYMKQLQQIRQDNSRQGQTKSYQDAQLGYMDRVLKETIRNNDMDHEYQMLMAQAAQTRADRPPGGGKIPKLRQGDIKELQDLSEGVATVRGLKTFIENGGKFGAVEINGVAVPGARTFSNYAASKGYGDKDSQASYKAKQEWDRMYTLVTRNRLFGATLTPNEQAAWEQANPSTSQTDEQIMAALPVMEKIMKHRMDKKASGLIKEGYNAEALADYTDIPGINVPDTAGGGAAGGQAPAAGAPKRVRVDAQGNIIP